MINENFLIKGRRKFNDNIDLLITIEKLFKQMS